MDAGDGDMPSGSEECSSGSGSIGNSSLGRPQSADEEEGRMGERARPLESEIRAASAPITEGGRATRTSLRSRWVSSARNIASGQTRRRSASPTLRSEGRGGVDAPNAVSAKKRRGPPTPCGQQGVHGHLCEKDYVYYACNQVPEQGADGIRRWVHLQAGSPVEKATIWWESAERRKDSCVTPDFVPSSKCLCRRAQCFQTQWTQHLRTENKEETRKCNICADRKSGHWHHPGGMLCALSAWFKSGRASTDFF
ncbi:unnamed protein product [Pylaiella littoralis]